MIPVAKSVAPALICAGLLASCGPGSPDTEPTRAPTHSNLAADFVPRLEALAGDGVVSQGTSRVWADDAGRGLWTEHRIPDGAWTPVEELPGLWSAPRTAMGLVTLREGSDPVQVHMGEVPLRSVPSRQTAALLKQAREGDELDLAPGHFSLGPYSLWVSTAADAPAPTEVRVSEHLEAASIEDGVSRISIGRYTGDGFLVPPGYRQELEVSLPEGTSGAILRFYAAVVPIAPHSAAPGAEARGVRFRVTVSGSPVFEHEAPVGSEADVSQHAVSLPPGPARRELAFEVEGDAAVTGILAPRISTLAVDDGGEDRPDVFVFLADTFRADNLAAYGGDPRLTPNLNRLAGDCVAFLSARSPSSWTLPAHASAFTGLTPPQSGVDRSADSLAPEAVTLAEVLRDAGYRTGAVTDGSYVSPTFGLGQGFEFFEAAEHDTAETLRTVETFLAADDGRPVFLFVQTYRAHLPYRVSDETRARLGDVLSLEKSWNDFDPEAIPRSLPEWSEDYVPEGEEARAFDQLEGLYRGASADLDREFAPVFSGVQETGFASDGVFVFTSDHGEAFWEHGLWAHGNGVWEEHVRIPLLVRAPGLEPRVDTTNAMLTDLPRTVAGLAGVPPPSVWGGRDLFAAAPDVPRFSFECKLHPGGESMLAGYLGPYKFQLSEANGSEWSGESAPFLFDLTADPGESESASVDSAEWVRPFLERCAPALREVRRPVLESTTATTTQSEREALQALGYGR